MFSLDDETVVHIYFCSGVVVVELMIFFGIFLVFINVRETFKHITRRSGEYVIFPEQSTTVYSSY